VSYPHTADALNAAYVRGEPFPAGRDERWAQGIAMNPKEMLQAMAADGMLQSWIDDNGRRVYIAKPYQHIHEWHIDPNHVVRLSHVGLICRACGGQTVVANRLPIEVPE